MTESSRPARRGVLAYTLAWPAYMPVLALVLTLLAAPEPTAALAAQDTVDAAADPTGAPAGEDRIEVEAVRFEGVAALDEDLLADAIATQATGCRSVLFAAVCLVSDADWAHERGYLDGGEVERDTERLALLYEAWGYPNASVTSRVEPTGGASAEVVYEIQEGQPLLVESIELRGLDRVTPPIPRPGRLPLAPGDPYALPRLDQIREWVRDRLAERGHPFGDVEVSGEVDQTTSQARLVLDVVPGPPAVFGAAMVEAEPPVDVEVVRSALRFQAGEPYRLNALRASERVLYSLPIVDRAILQPAVAVAPEGGSRDTVVVPVSVAVFPREAHGFDVEGTISSTECLAGGVFWRHRYFLGGPRLFSVGAGTTHLLAEGLDGGFPCTSTGSGPYAEPQYFAQADLRQPWPGDARTQLHFGVSARREAAPDVYVQEGIRASAGVSRDLGGGLMAMLRYSPARNEMEAVEAYYCGTYGICDAPSVRELKGPAWMSPVELVATWTPAGEPGQTVLPEQLRQLSLWGEPGWRPWATVGFEAAGSPTGSDFEYVRGIAEAAAVRSFGSALEAGARVRAGWLSGPTGLPPLVRLYGGGVNSVRGVAENLLGPRILVTREDNASALGCDPVPGGCPAGTTIGSDRIRVRPTGGDLLLEATAEARWWLGESLQLAAFLDYGMLRRDALVVDGVTALEGGWHALLAPGAGIRILTSLGPIRLDIGYDPSGGTDAPLFAESGESLVHLGPVRYDPFGHDDPGAFTSFFRRLQLHVGIGQPF